MSSGIILRPATADDLEALDDLHTRCMREMVQQVYEWRPAQFRETFDSGVNFLIVVDDVGVGLISYLREHDAIRIGNLLVEPSRQRSGIGTRVIQQILEKAKRENCGVRLRVLRHNPAVALYERLGFAIISEDEYAYLMSASS